MADGSAGFAFTPAVETATAGVWDKVRAHVTPLEWRLQAPLIAEINRLKREKNAVVLAHNYMTPDIFHGVGDFVGDSLGLAREAAHSDAAVIVQAGVHFMAETSKVLCPDKRVLIPDLRAGCSLAASITALMTGTAYRRSAELAGVLGPYDGYARNAQAHQRVIRKHAAAASPSTSATALTTISIGRRWRRRRSRISGRTRSRPTGT